MKPKSTLRSYLALAGSSLLAISSASAATLTWDSDTGTSGVQETTGTFTWAAADAKFWNGSANVATTNDTTTDIALFGNGTTLASSPIINVSTQSIGGLIFGATTTRGYTLTATTAQALAIGGSGITVNTGAQATTVGSANLGITLGAAQTWTNNAAAVLTIGGAVTNSSNLLTIGGSGGITVSGIIGNGAGGLIKNGGATLTLSGANSYTGTTTINGGTLTLSGTTGSIASSTGIALNSSNLTLTNAAGQSGVDRVGSVAITSIGGTITWTNPNGDNTANWAETLGAISLSTGQTNIVSTNAVNAARTQVLTLGAGSLTHAASNTSAITFSGASLGTGTVNNIVITSLGDTAANEIIGPWATYGTSVAAQTDYATYNITGGAANSLGIQGAGIAASAESAPWSTVHAATSNYTLANASGSAANGRLTATRNINSLRNTTTTASATATNGGAAALDYFTLASNAFANGDVVTVSGTGGTAAGTPYYIVNKDVNGANTFQISTTSNIVTPTLVDLSNTSAGAIAGGITLPTGFSLGTYGILNGSTVPLVIGGNGGTVTLPTTTSGNLFVTAGAGNIAIHAPIADNGAGVLDLVKSGSSTLTLSGNNTYTGATTINTGNLTIAHASALGTTAGNTIINATGSTSTGGQLQLTGAITSAENITITGSTEISGLAPAIVGTANTTNTLSGNITLSNLTGGVRIASGNAGARLNFTGTISQTGSSQALVFALGNAGGQTVTIDNPIALNGGGLILNGNGSPLILKGVNATDGSGIGTTTINSGGVGLQLGISDAINTTATLTVNGNFNLANFNQTVNALNGALTGVVSNSVAGTRTLTVGNGGGSGTYSGTIITGTGNIQLIKTGVGTQTLTGVNTYTGTTAVNGGTLELGVDNCLANSNVEIGAGTLKAAAGVNDTVGTLDSTAAATINLGDSATTLAFANSSGVTGGVWAGALNITGTFVPGNDVDPGAGVNPGSIRFGVDNTGLTASQLADITVNGSGTYTLDAFGYLKASGGGPGPLDHFAISAISSPQTVGTPITGITLTAKDASNVTVTGFTGTVNFGGTGGFTGTSATFTAGVLNGVSVIPSNAGSGLTFTVTDIGTGKTGSATFNIQTQYAAWSGAADFDADTNGDGVKNGLAFLLGATDKNVSALSLLPKVSQSGGDLILDFTCLKVAGRGSATLKLQHSKDLGISDAWTVDEVAVPDAAGVAGVTDVVTFTVPTVNADPDLVDLRATIPASAAAPGTKLFGRLQGNNP